MLWLTIWHSQIVDTHADHSGAPATNPQLTGKNTTTSDGSMSQEEKVVKLPANKAAVAVEIKASDEGQQTYSHRRIDHQILSGRDATE